MIDSRRCFQRARGGRNGNPSRAVGRKAVDARGDRGKRDRSKDMEHDVVSLLEENARLRALVVRLSDLVLKSVVDQK